MIEIKMELGLEKNGGLQAQLTAEGHVKHEKEQVLTETFIQWNRGLIGVMSRQEPTREFVILLVKIVTTVLGLSRPDGLENMSMDEALDELPDDVIAQLEAILRRGGMEDDWSTADE